MRFIYISILTCIWTTNAWAHRYNQHDCPDQYIHAAFAYPNQIIAAANWRSRHPHVDINLHLHTFDRFGWHPSVVALLNYPHFLAQIHSGRYWHQPHWHKRVYKKHRHNHWKKHHRHYHKKGKHRVYVYER